MDDRYCIVSSAPDCRVPLPLVKLTQADYERRFDEEYPGRDAVRALLRFAPFPEAVARTLASELHRAASIAANPFISLDLWCHLYPRMPKFVRFGMTARAHLASSQRQAVVGHERTAIVLSQVLGQLDDAELAVLRQRPLPAGSVALIPATSEAVPRAHPELGVVEIAYLANTADVFNGEPLDETAVLDAAIAANGFVMDPRGAHLVGAWLGRTARR